MGGPGSGRKKGVGNKTGGQKARLAASAKVGAAKKAAANKKKSKAFDDMVPNEKNARKIGRMK